MDSATTEPCKRCPSPARSRSRAQCGGELLELIKRHEFSLLLIRMAHLSSLEQDSTQSISIVDLSIFCKCSLLIYCQKWREDLMKGISNVHSFSETLRTQCRLLTEVPHQSTPRTKARFSDF